MGTHYFFFGLSRFQHNFSPGCQGTSGVLGDGRTARASEPSLLAGDRPKTLAFSSLLLAFSIASMFQCFHAAKQTPGVTSRTLEGPLATGEGRPRPTAPSCPGSPN